MMTQFLCSSCGYPIISSEDDLPVLFTSKYARAIILDSYKHPLLGLLPTQDFAGYRSFLYDQDLVLKIYNTEPTFKHKINISYTTGSPLNLWDELRIGQYRKYQPSEWKKALKKILEEHYANPKDTNT